MCVNTFLNENSLQRYTFFMKYANKLQKLHKTVIISQ